jgi:hypothetical protein
MDRQIHGAGWKGDDDMPQLRRGIRVCGPYLNGRKWYLIGFDQDGERQTFPYDTKEEAEAAIPRILHTLERRRPKE